MIFTSYSPAVDMRRNFEAGSNADEAPYSLPHMSGISGHDDWTAVKDRTMKKRIQNRVAQRTYRNLLTFSVH